jgi:O-antigen ligase
MTMRTGAPSPAALGLGSLVVAAIAAVDPDGLAPFGPARWLAVSSLALGTGGWALWSGRVPLHRTTLYLWLALVGLISLGALLGGDVPTALLGHPDRHLGLITWLIMLLLFCAGQQIADHIDRRAVIRCVLAAGLAMGIWCLWELVVARPIDIGAETSRLVGPFGSAAMLGAAACLLLPVALAMATDGAEHARWRIVGALAAVLTGVALIGAGSRAAWLAIATVGVITIAMRRPSLRLLVVIGGATLGCIALVAPRLDDVTDRSAGAASRLDEWRVAVQVVAAHPIVGAGPEGYRIAVAEGIDADYERTYGRERVLPDRAHAGPIDLALIGGVPAAMVYLTLMGIVGRRALRLIRAEPALAGIAIGAIAYGLQQLLLFPLAELDPIWWMLAGIVLTASRPGEMQPSPRPRRRLIAGAAMVLAPLALIAGILDVAADRLARRALTASAHSDLDQAVHDAERAVDLRPDNVRYRIVAATVAARQGTLAGIDAAIAHTGAAIDWSARDPIAADAHASFLLDRAVITGQQPDIDEALAAWGALVDRDPVRARWQLQLGRAAALDGDVDRARTAWEAAADLDPHNPVPSSLLEQLGAG